MAKVMHRSKKNPNLWGARWGIFNTPKPPPGVPWFPLDGEEDYFYSYHEAAQFIDAAIPAANALLIDEPSDQCNLRGKMTDGKQYYIVIWRL